MRFNNKDNNILAIMYVIFMGFNYPMLRFLSTRFSVYSNNGLRFLAGGLFLLLISYMKYREYLKIVFKDKKMFLSIMSISILASIYMYFLMEGLKYTSSLSASIFGILGMPISLIMASFVFKDERKKVKNIRFIIGSIIAILGSFVFIFYSKNANAQSSNYILGYVFLMISILANSIQNIFFKIMSKKLPSIIIATMISLVMGIVFILLSYFTNNIYELLNASHILILFIMLSGIYGIVTGLLLSLKILHQYGIVVFNILQLLVPISTAVVAYILLNESINVMQILSSLLIVISCTVALRIKK
ncbi:DMT family transporter [Oceanivirga salmonicida]|uniref:DMT family transporter n=1 Tax=Oceanivirga salmonicida TaxID=1769291 RepID=UPI00082F6D9F|nr:DMT family transporter [Oceanivirga salmonicida]